MNLSDLAKGLEDSASFSSFLQKDVNPLSGQLKMRIIYNPNDLMREIHARLRALLQQIMPELPFATGALPGCSPRKNIMRHRGNRHFYVTDVHSAYESTDANKLANVLASLDAEIGPDEALEFLERYCFLPGEGLVTGAPACPDLYNIYAGVLLDRILGEYCCSRGLVYTRYLDDITISSSDENGPIGKRKRGAIRDIIEKAGFEISHRKTFVHDLTKGPITINGIGLELGGRVFLPRRYLRFLRGMMRRARIDPEISYHMIAGRMGVFWAATDREMRLNRIESKLENQFERFKKEMRNTGRI